MKYWAYLNNEVVGPFEKEKLKELPNFGPASLICPDGAQAEGWKEASAIPEVRDALSGAPASAPAPAPAPAQKHAEPPLAMTMRGTLIETPVSPAPAAAPAQAAGTLKSISIQPAPAEAPKKAEESPLAMTMRGTIIEPSPAHAQPQAAAPLREQPPAATPALARALEQAASVKPREASTRSLQAKAPAASGGAVPGQDLGSQVAQLKQQVEQMSALLTSMGDSQFQLLNRLNGLENAIAEIKAMIIPPPPKKG